MDGIILKHLFYILALCWNSIRFKDAIEMVQYHSIPIDEPNMNINVIFFLRAIRKMSARDGK